MEDRIFYLKLLIDYWLEQRNIFTARMWYDCLVSETGIEYKRKECCLE